MAIWTALLLAAAAQAEDPGAALRAAVRHEDPRERRAAAEALAARADVPFERWEELCASFGDFDPSPPGEQTVPVRLWTPEGPEETRVTVYVPPGYAPGRPAPLLLQLHGTHGRGEDQIAPWRATADRLGMLIVAPSAGGANAGYTYAERERAATLSALRWARLRFDVDENRIFASGVSRGGHLAWDLALRHPDVFAALAPMIGGPRHVVALGENNLRYVENLARTPIRDLQGAQDSALTVYTVREAFERLAAWDAPDARLIEFEDLGHSFRFDVVDWDGFLGGARRDPRPETVVRAFARPGEGRAYWLEVLEGTAEVEEVFVPRAPRSAWERLDDVGRADYVQPQVDRRTARLEGRLSATRVRLEHQRVAAARVLFDRAMLPAKGEVLVQWRGRAVRAPARPDARVLLVEFVERFDRTFLPVLEVVLR